MPVKFVMSAVLICKWTLSHYDDDDDVVVVVFSLFFIVFCQFSMFSHDLAQQLAGVAGYFATLYTSF